MCTLIAKKNTDGWVVASNSDNPYSVRSQLICSFLCRTRTSLYVLIPRRQKTTARYRGRVCSPGA